MRWLTPPFGAHSSLRVPLVIAVGAGASVYFVTKIGAGSGSAGRSLDGLLIVLIFRVLLALKGFSVAF